MNWFVKIFFGVPGKVSPAYAKDVLIIDVRTPDEFATGHVKDALNLPMNKLGQHYARLAPDRARQIVVYGESGSSSVVAAQFLKLQRYANVINGQSASDVAHKLNRQIV